MWYRSGTVAVQSGSVTVTGTGTSWAAPAVKEGYAFIGPDGRLYEIEAVNSGTALTLASAYEGSDATAAAYVVAPTQSLNVELHAAIRELLLMAGSRLDNLEAAVAASAILTALKGVDGAGSGLDADTLDGVHASSLAPISSPSFTGTPDLNDSAARTLKFDNLEPVDVAVVDGDGTLAFDSSRGLLLVRAQQPGSATGEGVYTVLDSANVKAGANIEITALTAGLSGFEPIEFKVKQGAGSGLDSDKLDGQHGSFYRNASNLNAGNIPGARLVSALNSGPAEVATLKNVTSNTIGKDAEVAGTQLAYSGGMASGAPPSGATPAGRWKARGVAFAGGFTTFVRVF